jgi:hypothetical protein
MRLFLFWLLGQVKEFSCMLSTLIGTASRTLGLLRHPPQGEGWGEGIYAQYDCPYILCGGFDTNTNCGGADSIEWLTKNGWQSTWYTVTT